MGSHLNTGAGCPADNGLECTQLGVQKRAEPSSDHINRYQTVFNDEIDQFIYFKDSSAMLLRLRNGELWSSAEHGIEWIRALEKEQFVHRFVLHEFDNTRAYALTDRTIHMTEDQGKSWKELHVPTMPALRTELPLDFHPQEKDWLLFIGSSSTGHQMEPYISRDHGSNWDPLDLSVEKCIFGRDSKYEIQKETVYCTAYNNKEVGSDLKLIRTVDWGRNKETLFSNVIEYFVIEDFMAVASTTSGELTLQVSTDGQTFSNAQFPPQLHIERNMFTVLQSTTHSILLNIFKSIGFGNAHGTLFKSDENGIFYHVSLDNTNGNIRGYVDFEKMQSVDGIIMVNQVINADELSDSNRAASKKIRTMISWDDGGHWQSLPPPHNFDCSGKDCTLNLHSRTDIHGPGAIFSAAGVPGLAMGVGNVGPSLLPYDQGNTFLTRDAGHSWIQIREGEHLYEFGDQGSLLVLINDEGPTNELLYSWDQGDTWHTYQFSAIPVRVNALTTDPKSTTLRFVIVGHTRDAQRSQIMITVDFSGAQLRHCELDEGNQDKSDFERWIPKDDDGDDACLLGKKIAYWRRKKDRMCIVGNRFTDPKVVEEQCECRDIDFECDFGFWRNEHDECTLQGSHPDRPAQCKAGEKFKGRSGYKKNAKSTCVGGIDLGQEKEFDCGEHQGGIQTTKVEFSDRTIDYVYIPDTDRVFVRTADNKIWQSSDDGQTWKEPYPNIKFIAMYQNSHFQDRVYLITDSDTHYATEDKGASFHAMRVPLRPVMDLPGTVISFHKDEADYLLYLGESDCESFFSTKCHSQAYYSRDHGRSWHMVGSYIRSCLWGRDGDISTAHHDAILCEQYREQSGNQRAFLTNPLQFISSDNFFGNQKVLFEDIVGVTIFGKYMIVAASEDVGRRLQLYVSMDGDNFARASFPSNFELSYEAFTIMESANALWIHVTTNGRRGSEFGNILTSNSNGTYFVMSLSDANRNGMGIVDFEKMQGIEGIALANQVTNPTQANMGDPKQLVTRITADAGGSWRLLSPPSVDSEGKAYDCRDNQNCQLHLHAYSERRNTRDLFSTSSAVGLMIGVGNVGPSLTAYQDGDMFLTRDAGKTWAEVHKGAHIWEFADQGALLIMVDDEEPTNVLSYTTNEGKSWSTHEFAKNDEKIKVVDIITQPDGTSQKYVVFGVERSSGKTVGYHIDFSGLHPRQCKLDVDHPDNDDFELWSPEDTRGEKCLFGRETKYHRRIQDRDCYIGEKLVQPREIVRNCSCTIHDFECDFNFIRSADNKCVLAPGASPLEQVCDGTVDYIYKTSGYRKIAASTCEDGVEFDMLGEKTWCPGHSSSSSHWYLFILIPVLVAAFMFGVQYIRKQGRLGRIRLPDTSQASQNIIGHPVVKNVLAALVVIPVALLGLLSRINWPRSWSDLRGLRRRVRLPLIGRRGGPRYSIVGQEDLDDDAEADVLLNDYDGAEHLTDDADEL